VDTDSEESEYNASGTEDEDVGPCPPSRRSPSSEHPSSPDYSTDYSTSTSDTVGNVAGQHLQPGQWTLPPFRRRRVLHTFTGAPKGKAVKQHVTAESTPLSVLQLFFAEIITLLVVETSRYYCLSFHGLLADTVCSGSSDTCNESFFFSL
jgi:hypothetical protein